MVIERGSNGAGNESENAVDTRPVRLNELDEVPKKISGSLHRVVFTDHRGYPDPEEFVLVDPVFEDGSCRTRKLAGDPMRTPLFVPNIPQDGILRTNRWVTLNQLEDRLKELSPDATMDVEIHPSQTVPNEPVE